MCINWRTSPTLFANAFTLESRVTDRWTKKRINVVYFDNVVIAKAYIGPAGPLSKSSHAASTFSVPANERKTVVHALGGPLCQLEQAIAPAIVLPFWQDG